MATYRIGDIAPIQQGVVPNNDQYWLLNLDMVESNTGKVLDFLYVDDSQIGTSTISFDQSNVLYSKLRPYLNKVVLPDRAGYATSEMLPLKPDEKIIIREYLSYFLRSPHFVNYINEKTSGAKMPRANIADLKAYEIDCPSVMEQQRIVSQFNSISRIIQTRQQQLAALDALIKARFVETFGTVHNNVFQFAECTLESISDEFFAGGDKPADCTTERDEAHPYPVFANGYDNEGLQGYSAKCRVTQPAVTISARGTIGYCFIREAGFTPVVRLVTIVPNNKVSPVFLKYAIDTMDIKSSGTSQAQLTVPDFKRERIIVPPVELQGQFAAFVSQVDKSKVVIQKALDEAQILFDSLMQKYFG